MVDIKWSRDHNYHTFSVYKKRGLRYLNFNQILITASHIRLNGSGCEADSHSDVSYIHLHLYLIIWIGMLFVLYMSLFWVVLFAALFLHAKWVYLWVWHSVIVKIQGAVQLEKGKKIMKISIFQSKFQVHDLISRYWEKSNYKCSLRYAWNLIWSFLFIR